MSEAPITQDKGSTPQAPEAHDAFREHRKSSAYWLRVAQEGFELVDKLEAILPSFVRRRYRIGGLATGSVELSPSTFDADDPVAVDRLHADVNKLFIFLLGKRTGTEGDGAAPEPPSRSLTTWNGKVKYDFTMTGLPGFEGGLTIVISGLPAGSACRITKKVTGTRVVENVEYEMVCDDEPSTEAAEVA